MNGQEIKRNKKRVFRCSLFLFERFFFINVGAMEALTISWNGTAVLNGL